MRHQQIAGASPRQTGGQLRCAALEVAWGVLEPVKQVIEGANGQCQAGIRRTIVHAYLAALRVMNDPAREDHIANITYALIGLMRSKDPFIATPDDVTGLLQVQQCQPQSIEASPGVLYPVIDDEPAFRRFNGLGRQANLVGVPPCTTPRFRTTQWSPQCLRSGEYDNQMFAFVPAKPGTGRCRRAQRPLIRRGRSAASLSSGGIMAPLRSNVRKSWSRPARPAAHWSNRPCM